jgi:site-specific recombinase XerD
MTSEIAEKQDTTPKAAPPSLTESFVEQGLYLRNWSPRTVRSYRQAFRECPAELSKANLNAMVVALRQLGLSAGGINGRIRAINSFLSWMLEEGHLSERLRLKTLRAERRAITTFNDTDLKRLMGTRSAAVKL